MMIILTDRLRIYGLTSDYEKYLSLFSTIIKTLHINNKFQQHINFNIENKNNKILNVVK